jgi:hypothetical protein
MIPRHVETIFCDDIRQEIGGKLSLIGIYSGALFVPAFPATLPKLCLLVKVLTPADDPLRVLKLRILKDDEVLQEVSLNEEQLVAASDSSEDLTEEQREEHKQKKDEHVQVTQLLLAFSPLQLDGPCVLKVRVQTEATEDGELRGLSLRVGQQPQPFGATDSGIER